MKKQKAFTLAEMLVVIVIIGLVVMLSVPLMVSDARYKIQNTQFFEAYRAIYEGAKRAKLESPTGKLDIYRTSRFGMSTCDLFAQIFSLANVDFDNGGKKTSNKVEKTGNCIDGSVDETTGLCTDCVLSETECPLDRQFKREEFSDEKCSSRYVAGSGSLRYCHPVPTYISTYGDTCDDNIDDISDRSYFYPSDTALEKVRIESDIKKSCSMSVLGYNTNFDDPSVKPNFTTSNGLSFYGLNEFPAGICNGNNYQKILLDERQTALSYLYRDVYIDTNGKSSSPHKQCGSCDIKNFAYDSSFDTVPNKDLARMEAEECEEQLDCLKKNFGVYKFRVYSNGRVEPISNRVAGKLGKVPRMKYKLLYVANKSIVDVDKLFDTYQEAKDYKIPDSDQEFYFWNRNTKYGDGEINWKSHTKHGYYETPCKFDMDTLECAIIPVIPEVKVLPIKTKS